MIRLCVCQNKREALWVVTEWTYNRKRLQFECVKPSWRNHCLIKIMMCWRRLKPQNVSHNRLLVPGQTHVNLIGQRWFFFGIWHKRNKILSWICISLFFSFNTRLANFINYNITNFYPPIENYKEMSKISCQPNLFYLFVND